MLVAMAYAQARPVLIVGLVMACTCWQSRVHAQHAAGSHLAGTVSQALLERPVPLRTGIGRIHQAVSTASSEAQRYYDQGLAYLVSYVWTEAARSFHEALRRDPDLAMAHLGLAKVYLEIGATQEAHAWLEKARRVAKTAAVTAKEIRWIDAFHLQLEAAFAPADARAAMHQRYKDTVNALIALDPEDPHAWVLRGTAEESSVWGRGQGGGVGAIAYYEAALRRDPAHLAANHFLVHAYENIGQYAAAATYAAQYATAAPAVPHAQHMYAHVLPRLGRWAEARHHLLRADQLEREFYAAEGIDAEEDWHHGHNLHLLGTAHLRLGDVGDTERLFQDAFKLRTRGPLAGWYAAPWVEYLILRNRFDEAVTAARVVEEHGSLGRVLGAALASEALIATGRTDDAQRELQRAREANDLFLGEIVDVPRLGWLRTLTAHRLELTSLLIELRRGNPEAAGTALIALADRIAANPQEDAWAPGLFQLQRLAQDARRAGCAELATEVVLRMRRIDPTYPDTPISF